MSLSQDRYYGEIVGNLVSDPKLFEDLDGNKVCYCRIAVNPKAKKLDPRTKQVLSEEERNLRKAYIDLKIPKSAMAEKFAARLKKGDRVSVTGEMGNRKVEKLFWSKKENTFVSVTVDIDEDGQNCQKVYENHPMMWVDEFSQVIIDSGYVTQVCG